MAQELVRHVFMSYSRRDEEVMRRATIFLRSEGINIWVDNEKLIPGTPIWEAEIEKAIIGAGATVVLLSPDSKDSIWVRRELSYSEQYGKRIFPVLVRGNEDSSVPLRLITNQYINMQKNESIGLKILCTTLRSYLKELEAEEKKALEKAETLRRLQEERRARREALRQEAAERALREIKEKEALQEAERKKKEQERQTERIVKAESGTYEDNEGPIIIQGNSLSETIYATAVPAKKTDERVTGKRTNRESWLATGIITLGWIIGWTMWAIDNIFRFVSIFPIVYTIGGFFTAVSLRRMHIISDWTRVIWITLGWTLGGVIIEYMDLGTGVSISGLIGGIVTAGIVWCEDILSHWRSIIWTTLIWMIAGLSGLELALILFDNVSFIIFITQGAIMGAIGGFFTLWRIRTDKPSTYTAKRMAGKVTYGQIWLARVSLTLDWAFSKQIGNATNRQIWLATAAVALGWALAGAFAINLLYEFEVIAINAIGGFFTAILLRRMYILSDEKKVLWMTLGWTLGGVLEQLFAPSVNLLSMIVGGLATAMTLWTERVLFDWKSIRAITLYWITGWMVGITASIWLQQYYPPWYSEDLIISPFGGAVMGAVGGFFTLWRIRRDKQKADALT
jgi:hypothetical protein